MWWYLIKLSFVYLHHRNKQIEIMTKQGLKLEVEKLAKEENISFVKACQIMQGASAQLGNEEMISVLHKLKMESL
jgi:hypothetical protein